MVALVRSWQDLAKILASIPMHLGKRAKIRVTGFSQLIIIFAVKIWITFNPKGIIELNSLLCCNLFDSFLIFFMENCSFYFRRVLHSSSGGPSCGLCAQWCFSQNSNRLQVSHPTTCSILTLGLRKTGFGSVGTPGGCLVSSGFANARKSFWLKQGQWSQVRVPASTKNYFAHLQNWTRLNVPFYINFDSNIKFKWNFN